jgi:hypothetical protein
MSFADAYISRARSSNVFFFGTVEMVDNNDDDDDDDGNKKKRRTRTRTGKAGRKGGTPPFFEG